VAVEEGWQRRHPHVQLDREAMRVLLGVAVLDSEVLTGGLRNTNYKLRLAGEDRPVLLRLYTAEAVVSVCVRRRQTPATRQPNWVTATSGGASTGRRLMAPPPKKAGPAVREMATREPSVAEPGPGQLSISTRAALMDSQCTSTCRLDTRSPARQPTRRNRVQRR